MCFMLYAGTDRAIPRKAFNPNAPDISVQDLSPDEEAIKVHFHKPEVQNIGSTSNCGCDFRFAIFQNGGWPKPEFSAEPDQETAAGDQFNQEALVGLLRSIKEGSAELYGIWSGDCMEKPYRHEGISVDEILEHLFCFKERCFYEVKIAGAEP